MKARIKRERLSSFYLEHSYLLSHVLRVIIQVKYKEEYEKNRGRGHTEIPETHEMTLAKKVQSLQSKKMYSEKSKEMQKNVNLGPGNYNYCK